MFDKLRRMFSAPPAEREAPADIPLALASLLVEAARADETYQAAEQKIIDAALAERFALSAADAAALRGRAETAQADAVDIHQFTKIVKAMPEDDKIALVETLWRIVLSDASRDPHEDALIRRVCGLIYVSDPESGAARHRAQQAMANG